LNFELWRKIDVLYYAGYEPEAINGVRQEYVELFLNQEYAGVYALSERVDRKQLQLKKFKNEEIRGELYSGESWGASTFSYLPIYFNYNRLWGGFEYEYPDSETNWSNLYSFVDFAINEDSIAFYNTYQTKFNLDNAVNYFIFLNLLRATDNTGKNIFVARYNAGEPYFYVPWDLDGTFGIIWNGMKEDISNDILTNGFYNRLLSDNKQNGFLEKLKDRWNELRTNTLSADSIIGAFNKYFKYLKVNGVYDRELKAWENCEYFDYNNIAYTQEWLEKRLSYLDKVFNHPELIYNFHENKPIDKKELVIYPNPASRYVYIDLNGNSSMIERITLVNFAGKSSGIHLDANNGRIDISNLVEGVYPVIVDFKNG
jgi:hypothetical protein